MAKFSKEKKTNERLQYLTTYINNSLQHLIPPSEEHHLIEAKKELQALQHNNEIYWAQRSRTNWLQHGDKNTSFFHARANGRRKKNTIQGLFDNSSTWHTEESNILSIATDYFQNLFSTSNPTPSTDILDNIPTTITPQMNENLNKPYTEEEIVNAFRDIGPRKAPGIDGFPSSFYRQHWDILGKDII